MLVRKNSVILFYCFANIVLSNTLNGIIYFFSSLIWKVHSVLIDTYLVLSCTELVQ